MSKYLYRETWYSTTELSEMSGISAATIRARLRSGYSVEQAISLNPIHDSVEEFSEASWYEDWIGMENSYLHEIYWNWCVSNGYTPVSIKLFIKEIMEIHPQLQIVPSKKGDRYCRIIRLK